MRCLALGQAWRDSEGEALLVTVEMPQGLISRFVGEGIQVQTLKAAAASLDDINFTLKALKGFGGGWGVVDGYQFSASYQQALVDHGAKVLYFDDYFHLGQYPAHITVNQNSYATEKDYKSLGNGKFLLGRDYAVLRREFRNTPLKWKSHASEHQQILLTLGGADPSNLTSKIISALKNISRQSKIQTVLGSASPHLKSVKELASGNSQIEVLTDVQNMVPLMLAADLALVSGGTTCWELAYLGVPSLVGIIAENQVRVAQELDRRGAMKNLGVLEQLSAQEIEKQVVAVLNDHELCKKMSEAGRRLVDGHGTDRLICHLTDSPLWLRTAAESDSKLIWQWANDPVTRSLSFTQELIPWEGHVAWYKNQMEDSQCFFYMALNTLNQSVGQVRFKGDEAKPGEAVISVAVAPQSRGKGLGAFLISFATRKLFKDSAFQKVLAYVKQSNEASTKAFVKAGYKLVRDIEMKGERAFLFEKSRGI